MNTDKEIKDFLDALEALVQRARGDRELAQKLMYAITLIKGL